MNNVARNAIIAAIAGFLFVPIFSPIYFWLRPDFDVDRLFTWGIPYLDYWITALPYMILMSVMFGAAAYSETTGRNSYHERMK